MNNVTLKYSVECRRSNITPKQFFSYCNRICKKYDINLNDWITYEDWSNPITPCDIRNNHEEWDTPQKEICKMKPYNWQLYLQNKYNLIMEYDAYDEYTGFGYLYLIEYVR